MPVTRHANRAGTPSPEMHQGHGESARGGAHSGERSGPGLAETRRGRAGAARFFADRHGVVPDPMLIVDLGPTAGRRLRTAILGRGLRRPTRASPHLASRRRHSGAGTDFFASHRVAHGICFSGWPCASGGPACSRSGSFSSSSIIATAAACREDGTITVRRLSFVGVTAVDETRLRTALATRQSSRLPWGRQQQFRQRPLRRRSQAHLGVLR